MRIKIEWLSDTGHDCETCGVSYAEGANVYFDDELVIELTPFATCFDGNHYSESEVYQAILEKLGHELESEY